VTGVVTAALTAVVTAVANAVVTAVVTAVLTPLGMRTVVVYLHEVVTANWTVLLMQAVA